ncbi:MAG: hypothetical protein A2092_10460 [Rhodobacteraceae bacterium GWE1_64_9]|nr:MAG: hypothetical protein A2092_10460 [Rhodobacteraceae bacterium GWE1_64_9]OHC47605.1 MAG: hypothetical protein A2X69_09570 [Rhodobacteraceae bacterium GWF1_65_7]HBU15719.1 hypothetical protein [Gemmobacter sp.]
MTSFVRFYAAHKADKFPLVNGRVKQSGISACAVPLRQGQMVLSQGYFCQEEDQDVRRGGG